MRRAALILILSGVALWGCSAAPTFTSPDGAPSSPVALEPAQTGSSPQPMDTVPFEVRRITPQQVRARMEQGESIILADVRSRASYDLTHIASSISLPAADYQVWGPTLSREQTIVFY